MAKRPRSEVQSVIIHIKGDKEDIWIPKMVEKNSWVSLAAPKRGPWAKQGDLIAQVKNFKFSPNSTTLKSVLVKHCYFHRQLELESGSRHGVPNKRINYVYPSQLEDWQEPTSITDVVVVLHATIGEVTRGTRSHKDLLDNGIYFCDSEYVPPSRKGKFGNLTPMPLPSLNNPSWPIPDMSSSESFRARFFLDFQLAMKPSTGSKICRMNWFLPIHIMADLFNVQSTVGMHQTRTFYVWKPVSEELLASLMDPGWDVKREASDDVIKCTVIRESITFRYHVGRQTLYTTFGYFRERFLEGGWIPMDQCHSAEMRTLKVELPNGMSLSLDVGKSWHIHELREEINFYMESSSTKWTFGIIRAAKPTRWEKINLRTEKKMRLEDIGDDSWLRIKVA